MGCEKAYILPKYDVLWFTKNGVKMLRDDADINAFDTISTTANLMLLRAGLHRIFDDKKLVIVPNPREYPPIAAQYRRGGVGYEDFRPGALLQQALGSQAWGIRSVAGGGAGEGGESGRRGQQQEEEEEEEEEEDLLNDALDREDYHDATILR
ncbi:MAG: hypothetical protein Q9177_003957 [Variospora cf. flavescens]